MGQLFSQNDGCLFSEPIGDSHRIWSDKGWAGIAQTNRFRMTAHVKLRAEVGDQENELAPNHPVPEEHRESCYGPTGNECETVSKFELPISCGEVSDNDSSENQRKEQTIGSEEAG